MLFLFCVSNGLLFLQEFYILCSAFQVNILILKFIALYLYFLIVFVVVFLFLFRQQADQNFIYNFFWNIRPCLPLGEVKIGCVRFCYMDVITPGFLGSSQNIQYRMKKLLPCVKKGSETFFPRPITTPLVTALLLDLQIRV